MPEAGEASLWITVTTALAAATTGLVTWLRPSLGSRLLVETGQGLVAVLLCLSACQFFLPPFLPGLPVLCGPLVLAAGVSLGGRWSASSRGAFLFAVGLLCLVAVIWRLDAAVVSHLRPVLPRQDLLTTEAGNPVLCFDTAQPNPWIARAAERFERQFAGELLRVADPDPGYSCHGWTFAEGLCHIPSDEVPKILRDNGYRLTEEPRVGDVIVYLDPQNRILHSGVVRFRDGQGLLLVESKWDLLGRYLHRPEQQPYSSRYAFYRSDRPHHALHGVAHLRNRSERRPEPRRFSWLLPRSSLSADRPAARKLP